MCNIIPERFAGLLIREVTVRQGLPGNGVDITSDFQAEVKMLLDPYFISPPRPESQRRLFRDFLGSVGATIRTGSRKWKENKHTWISVVFQDSSETLVVEMLRDGEIAAGP